MLFEGEKENLSKALNFKFRFLFILTLFLLREKRFFFQTFLSLSFLTDGITMKGKRKEKKDFLGCY